MLFLFRGGFKSLPLLIECNAYPQSLDLLGFMQETKGIFQAPLIVEPEGDLCLPSTGHPLESLLSFLIF